MADPSHDHAKVMLGLFSAALDELALSAPGAEGDGTAGTNDVGSGGGGGGG